jgi:Spy/CpxP family protein refolding chaperone
MNGTRVLVMLAAVALAGCGESGRQDDFAEWQGHEIRSLSPTQVQALQDGDEASFAWAAERNGYPGAQHILELASKLELSDDQVTRVTQLRDETRQAAQTVGAQVLQSYVDLEALFRAGNVGPSAMQTASERTGTLEGQLMSIHLAAHIQARTILTAQQNAEYQQLRGYEDAAKA